MSSLVGSPLIANMRDPNGILRKLAVHFLGIQTTNLATTQIRDTNAENELVKTTNMHFIVMLGATLQKGSIENNDRNQGRMH